MNSPSKPTDVRIVAVELFFLPVQTRVPLLFGTEKLDSVTCARAKVTVADQQGRQASGWGETPLSVQWVWPANKQYRQRHQALCDFSIIVAEAFCRFQQTGHPIEIGHAFIDQVLPELESKFQPDTDCGDFPELAALVVTSPFDIALHDAYGNLHDVEIYKTYNSSFMSRNLSDFLTPMVDSDVSFGNAYPDKYLATDPPDSLPVWHLVGGLDPLTADEVAGDAPNDGHPTDLVAWIKQDQLKCLKVKLRGTDADWDFKRLATVGTIAAQGGVEHLSADFNCTVKDPQYVCDFLDAFRQQHPDLYDMILYVEQPFPYDLRANRMDVHEVSRRKPLYLDESAHDWKLVKLGRELGWTGVALKTCKTQTGAILSLCWAKAHGMPLMVQDLTNPMLAQIPHVLLAAHAETIMGVESNGMQFYPAASDIEAKIHPGIYRRRDGRLDLRSVSGPGFGYRIEEIERQLPEPAAQFTGGD